MKVKLLPAIIAANAFFVLPFASASSYQSEITAVYGESNYESDSPSAENYDLQLKGTYYFSAIDTANRPLAESAFLQKASNVYVNGYYEENKEKGAGVFDKSNTYGRGLGADFYIPNSIFFLGAGIADTKVKSEWKYDGDSYRETRDWDSSWYIKAGVAPVDGLLVWSEFYEDVDVSDFWNINAKYVMPVGSSGQWLNLEASYANSDWEDGDIQTLSLAADYYLDNHLSVGGGVTHYAYDLDDYNTNENEYFVRANQYFTDSFAMNVQYADGDYESRWELGATIRF